MRTTLRPAALVLVAAAFVGTLASPASADELFVDDPGADTVDVDTGGFAFAPEADIQDITIINEPASLVVIVDVADTVTFPVDMLDVTDEDFELEVLLSDPSDPTRQPLVWRVSSTGFATLSQRFGTTLCVTDRETDTTDEAYVLTADADCVRMVSRTLQVSAIITSTDSSGVAAQDVAPDAGDSDPVSSSTRAVVTRLAGTDRIETAIAVSQDDFAGGEARSVVLASAYGFPDALAGASLAYAEDAPMLLTATDALDGRTLAEIRRVLDPGGTVYVLGGTAALSGPVVDELAAAGYVAERVAGVNRFETAVAIADAIGSHAAVVVADGRTFTDALIASAAAPSMGGVVLLTDGSTLPASTRDYLRADTTDQLAIGTNAAAAVGSAIDSVVGANASELSVNVAQEVTAIRGVVAVATDASFPDSLAGGPYIARLDGPLLLTDGATLSSETGALLESVSGRLREVVVYGGTAAVSDGVVASIVAVL